MNEPITWQTIGAVITMVGIIAGVWWRWQSELNKVDDALHVYKLHVAETYATKQSVNEGMASVSKSVTDIGDRLDKRLNGITDRLDRVIETGNRPRRTSSN